MLWHCDPTRVMASSFLRLLDHSQRRNTVGRTPLDEWSARRRDLYLTTHNTHNRQTSMPLLGFEPTISAGERQQTYALDRAATGTGNVYIYIYICSMRQLSSFCRVRNSIGYVHLPGMEFIPFLLVLTVWKTSLRMTQLCRNILEWWKTKRFLCCMLVWLL